MSSELTSSALTYWRADPCGFIQHLINPETGEPFVFDNEKWAHKVVIRPFAIARVPVTQAEFAAFVDEGGYGQMRFWSEEGRHWLTATQARHPVYWQREAPGRWLRRNFDDWLPLVHAGGSRGA